jgi:hypothetical protein
MGAALAFAVDSSKIAFANFAKHSFVVCSAREFEAEKRAVITCVVEAFESKNTVI